MVCTRTSAIEEEEKQEQQENCGRQLSVRDVEKESQGKRKKKKKVPKEKRSDPDMADVLQRLT